jgi:hypothetical protein
MTRSSETALLRRVLIALVAAYALIAQGVLGGAAHAGMFAGQWGSAGDPAHIQCLAGGGPPPQAAPDHSGSHDSAGHLPDCCMAGCAGPAMALPFPQGAVALHHAAALVLIPAAADERVAPRHLHERPLVRGPPETA